MRVKKVMSEIDHNSINFYPALIRDYLNGLLKTKGVISWEYSVDQIHTKANQRKFLHRELLVSSLKKQYEETDLSPSCAMNLELLKQENTFTVCTGHQLCLFGGPAYFFSKIIDVLQLCAALNKDSRKNYVPVFWMASEDHDFEEISKVNLFKKELIWNQSDKGAVGDLNTQSMESVIEAFKNILGEKAQNIAMVFEQAYQSGKSLGEATRYFVNHFFGDQGLLILDGNDIELKKLLIPIVEQEIKTQITQKSVSEKTKELGAYKAQVTPRSVNLFYLSPQYRERLIVDQQQVRTIDHKHLWEINDFLTHVTKHPENISPNVLLRPVYQELCLPNVAYVGGAGEISYWLQLPSLFDELAVPFPVPIVRNSCLYLPTKQIDTIAKMGFTIADFFQPEDLILKDYLEKFSDDKFELRKEKAAIVELFQQIEKKSQEIDQNLTKPVAGELKRSISALENLEKRFRNAEKNNKTQEINKISALKAVLFPLGVLQERKTSFFEFVIKSKIDIFEAVATANTPLNNTVKVISY